MEWKDVPVFISSTFNDMHAERDYLVKNVFPELQEWCEERKLRLIDIDLRWGVSSADTQANNVVKTCLERIDECRPLFLCFLGQRRGWVPNDSLRLKTKKQQEYSTAGQVKKEKIEEISKPTYDEYPDLENLAGKKSVTEMEVEHALLSPIYKVINRKPDEKNPSPADHALFFFREHDFEKDELTEEQRKIYLNDEVLAYGGNPQDADKELFKLKERIRVQHKEKVFYYSCEWVSTIETPELLAENNGKEIAQGRLIDFKVGDSELKHVILEALKEKIENAFGRKNLMSVNVAEPSSFEELFQKDLDQQQLFIRLNSEGYIPRKEITDKLHEYIKGLNKGIFLLTASTGLGKTMLLANYADLLSKDYRVYARFCGASDLSSEQYNLWKSIFQEANISVSATFDELKRNFHKFLEKIVQEGRKTVIVIDAINQIQGGLSMISWFPKTLPDGLKIVISLKEDNNSDAVIQDFINGLGIAKNENYYSMPAFQKREEKEELIKKFLDRYFKALDNEHIDAICNLSYSDNPLFLKILLHDLRMFGAFKQLENQIAHYGDTPEKAFHAILERLENDFAYDVINPKESVSCLFGLLAHARNGLSEKELLACFKQKFSNETEKKILGTIRFYLRQVRPFMARREGRVDFLYESFMLAAKDRYKNEENTLQKILSECFLGFCDPSRNGLFECRSSRALTEYAFHLGLYNFSDAEQLYCNIPYLNIRCSICSVGELLTEYATFAQSTIKQYYNIVFRHAEILSHYENTLFSILYYSGHEHAKQQINDLLSSGKWNKPWICTKLLYQTENIRGNNGQSFSFQKLAETTFQNTVAIQTVKDKNLAFYSEGNGRIRCVDTITLVTHETIIRTLPQRPMNITASNDGAWLAVSYEDSTVEIIHLQFNQKNVLSLSESVKQLPYFLPLYDNGMFDFNDHFFLCQKDETTLLKVDIEGKSGEEEIYFEHPGELSSILFMQKNLILSIRQSDRTVLLSLNTNTAEILATAYVENTDITFSIRFDVDKIAMFTTDNQLLVFNEQLERQASTNFSAPIVAAVELETQLFVILKNKGNSLHSVLWNFKTDTQFDIFLDSTISCASQISVKENDDNNFFLISDNLMCLFILSKEGDISQKSKIIAAGYYAEQDKEEILASNLIIATEEDEYCTVIHNNFKKKIPESFNSPWRMALPACNEVYVFNWGKGHLFSFDSEKLTPIDLKSNSNIACIGNDNYLYFYDIARNLRCLQSNFCMDLSSYNLTSLSLYSLDDYIVLLGIADDTESGMKKEQGNESAPYLALFFEIVANGQLHFAGKRYFLSSKGKILNVAKSKESNWFYIAFSTPNTGKAEEPPTVGYGTIADFQNHKENEKILHCRKENLSMTCVMNTLFICAGGIIIGYNTHSLEYQVATVAEKSFKFIRSVRALPSSILAVSGKDEIMHISINL